MDTKKQMHFTQKVLDNIQAEKDLTAMEQVAVLRTAAEVIQQQECHKIGVTALYNALNKR